MTQLYSYSMCLDQSSLIPRPHPQMGEGLVTLLIVLTQQWSHNSHVTIMVEYSSLLDCSQHG